VAGRVFIYDRVGHDLRPLRLREDGTVGEGGGDAERYFYTAEDGSLVVGSAWDETCRLRRDGDDVWRGRWVRAERMPVTLTPHRGQVLLDWLGPEAQRRDLVGAEVGVWEGETSRILLQGLPGLRLYLVDPWHASAGEAQRDQAACDAAMTRTAGATAFAADRRVVVPCGHERAAGFVPGGLDLVFLDADHGQEATREAIAAWWPKVRPGGLLAGHDYGNPNYPGVRAAVDEFARRHGLRVRSGADMVWAYEVRP
jgi:predicted O-methyltransferase YrrM